MHFRKLTLVSRVLGAMIFFLPIVPAAKTHSCNFSTMGIQYGNYYIPYIYRYPYPKSGGFLNPRIFKRCADKLVNSNKLLAAYYLGLSYRFSRRIKLAFDTLIPAARNGFRNAARELCYLQAETSNLRGNLEWCRQLERSGDILGYNIALRHRILSFRSLKPVQVVRQYAQKEKSTKIAAVMAVVAWAINREKTHCTLPRYLEPYLAERNHYLMGVYGAYGLSVHQACGHSPAKYMHHLKKSAEHPRSSARLLLYQIYDYGLFGIPKNKKLADYWVCRIFIRPLRLQILHQMKNAPTC